MSLLLGGCSVGPGDQLEEVAARIVEIDPAPAIEVVDLARQLAAEIGVVADTGGADASERRVELGFAARKA